MLIPTRFLLPRTPGLSRPRRSHRSDSAVDDGEAIDHFDDARRRVQRTLAAGGARHAAEHLGLVAFKRALALHDQLLLDGHEHEEVLRAHFDAVVAGGALVGVHDGQAVAVHLDRIEIAYDLAVRETQTTPRAALSASRDRRRGDAGRETAVVGALDGDALAAGAKQTSHSFPYLPRIDAEELRDDRDVVGGHHGALGGLFLGACQCFRERPATRAAARTAVRSRQQVGERVEAGILPDLQLALRQRDERSEYETETAEGECGDEDRGPYHAVSATCLPPVRPG